MKTDRLAVALAVAASTAFCAPLAQASKDSARDFEIRTLSTRANTVSGGDVLIEVRLPRYAASSDLIVRLNGSDVSGQLATDPAGGRLIGLVTGLRDGKNRLTVSSKQHHRNQEYDSLEIVNHPIQGEIFAPHQRPWVCETAASGLGAPPASGPCLAPTIYEWFYRNTAGVLLPLIGTAIPPDVAKTTTIDGTIVNYIVRVESGAINESIYRIAILDDPANPISNPWSALGKKPGPGWNGKLTWPFGGGASPAFRSGRNAVTSALQDIPLSLGFAVAFGTRNTFGTGADDIVSAETLMMIKERFIEQYGVPKFTIGSGGSGGAIQQHLISYNYPGLLDAITPNIPYPDVVSIAVDIIDCRNLHNYFDNIANPADWPGSRRAKVDGYAPATSGPTAGQTVCQTGWSGFAIALQDATGSVPNRGFDAAVPLALRYDPVANPGGARGTLWDSNVASIGRDPDTGFARSLYDNVGVQYGFKALNSGAITKAEFLDLNEKIGGRDVDGNILPHRTQGDRKGIENAYRHGRVTSGENWTLPTIHTRDYRDFNNDIHTRERSFSTLERWKKGRGTTANLVMWTVPTGVVPGVNLPGMALLAHNEWLENLRADTSNRPYAEKVIRNKPATLKDGCWDSAGNKYEELPTLDPAANCNQLFPVHENVRIAAGGPVAGDILKCRLKPVKASDYAVTFSPDEHARLKAIFPDGVCDWSRPGVGQKEQKDTWLSFPKAGKAKRLGHQGEDDDDHDDDDDDD
ncbi:MAG: DUF6351 family protein [Betaproteobacteria bacterium]|nr:DUF6351 family protein [Betaproteobacteria bacterium]